jgi:hypothetical protein
MLILDNILVVKGKGDDSSKVLAVLPYKKVWFEYGSGDPVTKVTKNIPGFGDFTIARPENAPKKGKRKESEADQRFYPTSKVSSMQLFQEAAEWLAVNHADGDGLLITLSALSAKIDVWLKAELDKPEVVDVQALIESTARKLQAQRKKIGKPISWEKALAKARASILEDEE